MDEEFKQDVLKRLKRIEWKIESGEHISDTGFSLGLYLIALGVGFLALGKDNQHWIGGALIGIGFIAIVVVSVYKAVLSLRSEHHQQ